jgi:glyoxylase-like metal-dependent hydrolase (beta-lactamase superfamily II)
MNRRTAIKNSGLIALLGLAGIDNLFAAIKPTAISSGFHKLKLGKLDITIITDGHIIMSPIQPNFAPGIAADKVNKDLTDHFASTKEADLSINVMVIKDGAKTILIDTGCGANFGESSGWMYGNLSKAGINPDSITDVVISHAHPDHIGGLTGKDGKLTFPKAAVHLSRIDHDFWMSAKPDFSKSKMKDNKQMLDLCLGIARRNITAAKANLHLFEDGASLLGCLKMQIAAGHTPGHTVTNISSDGQEMLHVADLVHSPILVFDHPEWGFEGDTDFNMAVATRKKVLQSLTTSRKLTFSYHLPWPGLGHVKSHVGGYDWLPTLSALPD